MIVFADGVEVLLFRDSQLAALAGEWTKREGAEEGLAHARVVRDAVTHEGVEVQAVKLTKRFGGTYLAAVKTFADDPELSLAHLDTAG